MGDIPLSRLPIRLGLYLGGDHITVLHDHPQIGPITKDGNAGQGIGIDRQYFIIELDSPLQLSVLIILKSRFKYMINAK